MTKGQILKLGFIVVVIISILLHISPFTSFVENKFLDRQFRFLSTKFPKTLDKDVVIVGIDEQTFKTYREPLALWHPYLGNFFEAMAIAQPSVVGLDLVLPDRSYDFLVEGHDKKLLAGLLKLKSVAPVVLGQTIDEKGKIRSLFAPLISLMGKDALGLVLVNPDPDGTIRRFHSSAQFGNNNLPTLAPLMAEKMGLGVNDRFINYSYGKPFDYISLQQVNTWLNDNDTSQLQNVFANKPVILGSVLPFIDRHLSPVPIADWETGNNKVPGVLIHAQILRSLIANDVLQKTGGLIIYLLLAISTLFFLVGHRPKLGFNDYGFFYAINVSSLPLPLIIDYQVFPLIMFSNNHGLRHAHPSVPTELRKQHAQKTLLHPLGVSDLFFQVPPYLSN